MIAVEELLSPLEIDRDITKPILPSPNKLDSFIGQESSKVLLRKVLEVEDNIPPILISGPAGLGKSALAVCIGKEKGKRIRKRLGSQFGGEFSFLTLGDEVREGDVVLIDEAQNMIPEGQYALQSSLEMGSVMDYKYRRKKIGIIVVTMSQTRLLRSLRDRCVVQLYLEYYSVGELTEIAYRAREYFGIECGDGEGFFEVGRRSRGIPRLALRYTKLVSLWKPATVEHMKDALEEIGVDGSGLTRLDRSYLNILRKAGKPVALRTLAASTGIEEAVILEDIEPYLMRVGLMVVTGKGRVATLPKGD